MLGWLQLVGDRLIEILRRQGAIDLDAVDEKGRRRHDAKLLAERDVALDERRASSAYFASKSVTCPTSRAACSTGSTVSRRLVRVEPILQRLLAVVRARQADGHGGVARRRMDGVRDVRRCSPRSSG